MSLGKQQRLEALLIELQQQLMILDVWENESPSEDALTSTQPFAIDYLSFSQWLQWLFLPQMAYLLERGQALPERCGIEPMAAEWGQSLGLDTRDLSDLLLAIDRVLSNT